MLKTYKYRIYPTNLQKEKIIKHIGCSRWVYNYALEKKIKAWETEKKNLSRFDIQAEFPKLKKEKETIWLKEVRANSLQASLLNLDKAYRKFFKEKKGFPKFKSKHTNKQSFSIPQYCKINFEKGFLTIPKIKNIHIVLHRKFEGKIKTVTIKKTPTNKYFAFILVEVLDEHIKTKQIADLNTIGLDLGIKDFAITSQGEKISNPKILKKYEKKLAKKQKILSRRVKGSNNRLKAKLKVAKIHEKIANTRKDFLNKLSYKLTHENQVSTIVIEDLAVTNMMKNHKLAKAIGDCSWSEFVRQLEYKCLWYGINLIKIGKFEPSSKLCSNCGYKNTELTLKDREWTCKKCDTPHDRDINAAKNIKEIGLKNIPAERRELTLGKSRVYNLTRRTKKPLSEGSSPFKALF